MTRADFYVGRGLKAEWLGSIACDGYPEGLSKKLLKSNSEKQFRKLVGKMLSERNDATLPEHGWPWPWENSQLTDFAYAFDEGKVWHSMHAGQYPREVWWPADKESPDEDDADLAERVKGLVECVHPDMSAVKNVTLGPRSGLLVVRG